MINPPKSTPRSGRKRIHFDDAERARAYRERKQARFEDAEIARERWEAPSPGFVGFIVKRCVEQASDPCAAAVAVLAKALQGIGEASGPAAVAAAINFVTSRKEGCSDEVE